MRLNGLRWLILCAGLICSGLALAVIEDNEANEEQTQQADLPDPTQAIKLLNSTGPIQGVKLLDNRFRIDYEIDEITMLFFRKHGSSPVILIRPDGSKLYAPTMTKEEGEWFDDLTYDMIRLKNPAIGPWQAVGKLETHSKLMIVSDIQLHVDELPPLLFVGESVNLLGRLTNDGTLIDYRGFSNVVKLSVTFSSTNKNEYDNFGADAERVAEFYDDGKGFDKKPKDSVFTGEFKLNLAAGEWVPSMYLDLALFNRELTLDPVIVNRLPFEFSVDKTLVNGEYHVFNVKKASDDVKWDTFVFNGKAYFPNGEIETFAMKPNEEGEFKHQLLNYEDGLYKVKLSAFGQNINGRDMMIDVPEYSFNVDPPPPPEPTAEELAAMEAERLAIEAAEAEAARIAAEEAAKTPEWVIWTLIIGLNLLLLIVAFLVLKFVVFGKISLKMNLKKKKKSAGDAKADQPASKPASGGGDDIIDLSLPDDS